MDIRDKFVRASIANYKIYGNTSLSAVVKLCVDGVGVAAIPPAVIRHELESKALRLVDVSGGELTDLHFTISYMLTADAHLLEAVAALALQGRLGAFLVGIFQSPHRERRSVNNKV